MREHLSRLRWVYRTDPTVFFLTLCVEHRRPVLASAMAADVLVAAWHDASQVHGWAVGRYVVMPDHVHFFCTPYGNDPKSLSAFVGGWKTWTRRGLRRLGERSFRWQAEFFDHLLRSNESYAQKWEYVRQNPVRAGLTKRWEDWPYQGEITPLVW